MLTLIPAARYPSSAQPPAMVVVARSILNALPHPSSSSPGSSPATSSHESEKAPLPPSLPATVQSAASAVKRYGTFARSEARRTQLKQSISRPIVEAPQAEMEASVPSVYSTQSWSDAFEYDSEPALQRSSIQTFTSSERSYSFF